MDAVHLAEALRAELAARPRGARAPRPDLDAATVRAIGTYALTASEGWSVDCALGVLFAALVPTAWPERGMGALRDAAGGAGRSGVCGTVWKKDELAYKCKTCERDPTCAICVSCFRHGDHVGHDYAMIRTGGGCCDCGDVQAWKPTGFCKRHGGASAENEDPAAGMPSLLRENVLGAVGAVSDQILTLSTLLHVQIRDKKEQDPNTIERVERMLFWLGQVVECGDGLRRVVGVYLAKAASPSWLMSMLRLDGVERLPVPVLAALHTVYYQLITDLVFKRAFLEMFVENYERFIHALVTKKRLSRRRRHGLDEEDDEDRKHDIVDNFSVQLFTVPALIPVMIRKDGLLDVLINMLLRLFETTSAPVLPYSRHVEPHMSAYANELRHLNPAISSPSSSSHAASASNSTSKRGRGRHVSLPVPCAVTCGDKPSRWRNARRIRIGGTSDETPSYVVDDGDDHSQSETLSTQDTDLLPGAAIAPEGWTWPETNNGNDPDNDVEMEEQSDSEGSVRSAEEHVGDDFYEGEEEDGDDPSHDGETGGDSDDDVGFVVGEHVADEDLHDVMHTVEDDQDDGEGEGSDGEELGHDRVFLNVNGIRAFTVRRGHLHADSDDMDASTSHDRARARVEAHAAQQQASFEEGLGEEATRGTNLSDPARLPATSYRLGVQEARNMTNAAANGLGPIAHTMRIDWVREQPIIDNVCWRVIYDLRYVITHVEVATHLMHRRPDLLRLFVRLLSILQGMHPMQRRLGDHIPREIDTWAKAFTLEIEFFHLVEFLVTAFCSNPGAAAKSIDIDEQQESIESGSCPTYGEGVMTATESRGRAIRIVRQCLDEWLEREEVLEAMSVQSRENFTVAHSVSVHLPLHRLLALLGHHVIRLDNADVAFALTGTHDEIDVEDTVALMRHPQRIQVFLAQIRAGMWKRNGRAVVGQSMFYRSVFCAEWFVVFDLFMQQMCTVVVGPSVLVREILRAFQIKRFGEFVRLHDKGHVSHESETMQDDASGLGVGLGARLRSESANDGSASGIANASDISAVIAGHLGTAQMDVRRTRFEFSDSLQDMARYAPALLEDLLAYLVHIGAERARCGLDDVQYLRRKLIHLLCHQDHTHSQLLRACPLRISQPRGTSDVETCWSPNSSPSGPARSIVETTLDDIADYVRPRGMDQGRYCLKDRLWEEFDHFAPQLSARERGVAEVRCASACARARTGAAIAIPVQPIYSRPLYGAFVGLKSVATYLCGARPDSLATALLQKCLPSGGGLLALEGALAAGLHLTCMAVELGSPASGAETAGAVNWLDSLSSKSAVQESALGAVCEMYIIARSEPSSPYGEVRSVLERILRQAWARSGTVCKGVLEQSAPQLFGAYTANGEGAGAAGDEGKREAERKKRLLKMKKQQQASAMASMREAMAKFAEAIGPSTAPESGEGESVDAVDTIPGAADFSTDGTTQPTFPQGVALSDVQEPLSTKATEKAAVANDEEHECALCHDTSTDAMRLMGLVGFVQKTQVPRIARQRAARVPKYPCDNKNHRRDLASHAHGTVVHNTELDALMSNVEREGAELSDAVTAAAAGSAGDDNERDFDVDAVSQDEDRLLVVDPADVSIMDANISAATLGDEGLTADRGGPEISAGSVAGSASRAVVLDERTHRTIVKKLTILNWDMLNRGVDADRNVHFAFCGHAMHIQCFERYFASLMQSRANRTPYEGFTILNLARGEFLCPVCRRLANIVLPLMNGRKPLQAVALAPLAGDGDRDARFISWLRVANMEIASSDGSGRAQCSARVPGGDQIEQEFKGTEGPLRHMANTASAVNTLRVSIASRASMVLRRLGLQAPPVSSESISRELRSAPSRDNDMLSLSCSILSSSAIATVICAELATRSGAWDGLHSRPARRRLGTVIWEARLQIAMVEKSRSKELAALWNVVTRNATSGCPPDSFAVLVFLCLLWPRDLSAQDLGMIVRVAYCMTVLQAQGRDSPGSRSYQSSLSRVQADALLFLRRTAVFVSCIFDNESAIPIASYREDGIEASTDEVSEELQSLTLSLGLPPLDEALGVSGSAQEAEILSWFDTSRTPCPRTPFVPRRFGLISLPPLFQDLLEDLDGRPCDACGKLPRAPALCLACGELICTKEGSCGKRSSRRHAEKCCSGIGVFLILTLTSVQVLRSERFAVWGSPYLDEHGEEDEELHRGKPLHLNRERYSALERLWLTHGFDHNGRLLNSTTLMDNFIESRVIF